MGIKPFWILMLGTLAFFFSSGPLAAEPTVGPFGLAIGKDTMQELTSRFNNSQCSYGNISPITKGPIVFCPSKYIDFEGLKDEVTIIFDTGNVLSAVQLVISKHQYESIRSSLAAKYKITGEKKAFVGDRYTKFNSSNINILLDAPHMGFEMTLLYSTKQFDETYNQYRNNLERAKKDKQNSQL